MPVKHKYFDNDSGPWTPWGRADSRTTWGVWGVSMLSTPGHGGMRFTAKAAERLSPAARENALFLYGAYWFEEDCAVSIPLSEHPEWCKTLGMDYDLVLKTVKEWEPRYWRARKAA